MSIRRFFSDQPVLNGTIAISGDEAFHLLRVNRARTGDEVEVVNGNGALFYSKIRSIKGDSLLLDILEEHNRPRPPVRTIIAPSLLKKKNMSLMMEKLTEMGVDEIRPVLFSRTEDRYNPGMMEKWHKIAVQSLKVNKRFWVTHIFPPVKLDEIIVLSQNIDSKILLDLEGRDMSRLDMSFPSIAVIGPPGDFIQEEKQALMDNGFEHYRINDCTLKSETAAISIASLLKMREQPG